MFPEHSVPTRTYVAKARRALSGSYRRLHHSTKPFQIYDEMQTLVIKLALAGVAGALLLVTLLVH
jgi:hypothetical protein